MTPPQRVALLATALLLLSAGPWAARGRAKYQRPGSIPFPQDNQYSREREMLGKMLFFDPRLSGSRFISCATCHNPAFSWGDGLPKAIGHGMKQLGRRTPTILNLAWATTLFWDGRAASLEEQALGPIAAAAEMNQPLDKMVAVVRSIPGYEPRFERAYPGEAITEKTVARAIATFERAVVSGAAPFDAWIQGKDDAISEEARRGFEIFNGKGRCAKCHSEWNFTDDGFHDIGLAGSDKGRGRLIEGVESVQYAFKTPTLRNVALRAPYMHDGSEATLADVIDLYNRGGRVKRPSLSPDIKPLDLTAREKSDLIAFLQTLTGADQQVEIPLLPR